VHARRVAARRRRNVQARGVIGRNVVTLGRHFRPARRELVSVDVVLYGLVVAGKKKKKKASRAKENDEFPAIKHGRRAGKHTKSLQPASV